MKIYFFVILVVSLCVKCQTKPDKEIQNAKTNVESTIEQAERYYQDNYYTKALELYNSIDLEVDSINLGDFYFKRGYCKLQLEMYEESNFDFLQSIRLNYKVAKSYHNIAFNYYGLLEDSLAVIYFRKSLELDSTNSIAKQKLLELEKEIIEPKEFI